MSDGAAVETDNVFLRADGSIVVHPATEQGVLQPEELTLCPAFIDSSVLLENNINTSGMFTLNAVCTRWPPVLLEAYNPLMMLQKLWPVFLLRCTKCIALVATAGVQKLLCGVGNGEDNVLLDFVGKHTEEVYLQIYGHHLRRRQVMSYLQKRLIFCCITTTGTLSQFLLVGLGYVQFSFFISVLLMPITFLDRQWNACVCKMPVRYERTVIHQLHTQSRDALRDALPGVEVPRVYRYYSHPINLINIEMAVGAMQFLFGAVTIALAGSFFLGFLSDGQHIMGVSLGLLISVVRFCKEGTNWASFVVLLLLTPQLYAKNEEWFHAYLEQLQQLAGGVQPLIQILQQEGSHQDAVACAWQKVFASSGCGSWQLVAPVTFAFNFAELQVLSTILSLLPEPPLLVGGSTVSTPLQKVATSPAPIVQQPELKASRELSNVGVANELAVDAAAVTKPPPDAIDKSVPEQTQATSHPAAATATEVAKVHHGDVEVAIQHNEDSSVPPEHDTKAVDAETELNNRC